MLLPNRNKGQKKCPYCKEYFTKINQIQATCTKWECLEKKINNEKIKQKKQRKEQLKNKLGKNYQATKESPLKLAQKAFNSYIRVRDYGKPCMSCRNYTELTDSSHFYSVGSSSSIRFNLWNVHSCCRKCNRFLGGNLVPYEKNLIEKIGQERFNKLKELKNKKKKYNKDYLERLKNIFIKKTKKLRKNKYNIL